MAKLSQLEAQVKERDRTLFDLTSKNKELQVNLHMEQEQATKLKAERDALESELKGLKEDISILRQSQNQSSDTMGQKLKEAEIEKRSLKARVEQLEADLYKANREKADAMKARE
jgi:50S ribosomal subunit-associated GTPase HflX